MKYIPWKLIKSWSCLACGSCCRKFAINLTWEEYRKIGRFWPQKVRIKNKKPYLGRKKNGKCKFLTGKLCQLHMLNMKPFACKVWPFKVMAKPDRKDKEFNGLYQLKNAEYFVYIHTKCLGINKGNPANLERAIQEVIDIYTGLKKKQYYSTNTVPSNSHLVVNRESSIQSSSTLDKTYRR